MCGSSGLRDETKRKTGPVDTRIKDVGHEADFSWERACLAGWMRTDRRQSGKESTAQNGRMARAEKGGAAEADVVSEEMLTGAARVGRGRVGRVKWRRKCV